MIIEIKNAIRNIHSYDFDSWYRTCGYYDTEVLNETKEIIGLYSDRKGWWYGRDHQPMKFDSVEGARKYKSTAKVTLPALRYYDIKVLEPGQGQYRHYISVYDPIENWVKDVNFKSEDISYWDEKIGEAEILLEDFEKVQKEFFGIQYGRMLRKLTDIKESLTKKQKLELYKSLPIIQVLRIVGEFEELDYSECSPEVINAVKKSAWNLREEEEYKRRYQEWINSDEYQLYLERQLQFEEELKARHASDFDTHYIYGDPGWYDE